MAACASVVVLWGATPIAVTRVGEGDAVSISEDGVVSAVSGRLPHGVLVVRVFDRGAHVAVAGGGSRGRALKVGERAEVAVSPPSRGGAYRSRGQWASEPLAVEVAVMEDEAGWARRPARASSAWIAIVSSAAAHVAALGIAAAAMPDAAAAPRDEGLPAATFLPPAIVLDVSAADLREHAGSAARLCIEDYDGPPVGRTMWVEGSQDNADPHIAKRRADGTVAPLQFPDGRDPVGDPFALTAPYGRDDSFGNMSGRSESAVAHGPRDYRDFTTCFDPPPPAWTCSEEQPAHRRRPRVVVGPIAVSANVPRWLITNGVRRVVERARDCYDRALADDPFVSGRVDAVLRVVPGADDVEVQLKPAGGVAHAHALSCCLEQAHSVVRGAELPTGARATALYSITFGRPSR